MTPTAITTALLAVLLPTSALAGNWAHWRGPAGNSTAPDAKPPIEWSASKNVKWKVPVPGRGSGSPVIWNDMVFVVSAVPVEGGGSKAAAAPERSFPGDRAQRPPSGPQGRERGRGRGRRPGGGGRGPGGFDGQNLSKLAFKLFCFDRAGGKLRWEKTAVEATPHQGTHSTNGFASASPCTDGEHVYAHFGSRGLFCYTVDGKFVWKRDDFGKMNTRNSFGEGSSPTLHGDVILVPWDHEGPSALYALDAKTGKTIWKTERNDEPTCWATPLVVEHKGRKQVVMNGQTCARGYDFETGKELWRCGGQTDRPVASAVAAKDLVIVGSGFRGSFIGAFKLDGKGDLEGTDHVAWTLDRNTPDIASPLVSGDLLYYHRGKSGMLSCVDAATGKVHYDAEPLPGISSTYASPVAANGHVYLTGRSGTTVVIKDQAGAKPEIVATNELGEGVDATPAPVDNELFIRGEKHLFCIAAK